MAMAQLRKNSSGSSRITGSVAGSKSQFSFPGKKMPWKMVKARSKFVAARAATIRMMPPKPQAAQKPGVRPARRGSAVRRRRQAIQSPRRKRRIPS